VPTIRDVMSPAVHVVRDAAEAALGGLAVVLGDDGAPRWVVGAGDRQDARIVSADADAEDLWRTVDGTEVLAGRLLCLVVVADGEVVGVVTRTELENLIARSGDPLARVLVRAGDDPGREAEAGEPRHVNLCFVWPYSRNRVPQARCLRALGQYELRVDIGRLSIDSIVVTPDRFPAELVPATDEGTWLDIVAVSEDFRLPKRRFPLFLPRHGASWVCGCRPGERHTCTPEQRGRYLYIPVEVPAESGPARLRVTICAGTTQVQSLVVYADIGPDERTGTPQSATVDFTLTAGMSDLRRLPMPLPLLSIGVSPIADQRQAVLMHRTGAEPLVLGLTEAQMSGFQAAGRDILTTIQDALPADLRARPELFRQQLARLATYGRRMYAMLVSDRSMRAELGDRLRKHGVIQIARVGSGNYVIPWALVYDIPLLDGDPAAYRRCPVVDDIEGLLGSAEVPATDCPFASSHATNTLCPFGFWGYRHVIEMPPTVPHGHGLATRIRAGGPAPKMVVGHSALSGVDDHVRTLGATLHGFGLTAYGQRAALIDALHSTPLSFVYFLGHCRRDSSTSYLEIGRKEQLTPTDLAGDDLAALDHWRRNSPLVFINACRSAAIAVDSWLEFVSAFAQMYAAGVIGTEIGVRDTLARKVAEHVWACLARRQTVGEALHSVRMRLLRDRNLLGLAYTAYCSAALRLDN